MTFTIEQINRAWIKYNRPEWMASADGNVERLNIPKMDFVSFLIQLYDDEKTEGAK